MGVTNLYLSEIQVFVQTGHFSAEIVFSHVCIKVSRELRLTIRLNE